MKTIFTPAYWIAIGAHGSQQYGDKPYVDTHCRAVVEILVGFGFCDPQWLDAGWLHDAIEDTGLEFETIKEHCCEEVADLVWAVSGQGDNRRARNADIARKIILMPRAAILKTADRIANRENAQQHNVKLYEMYQKEQSAFINMVGDHIPHMMLERLCG